MAEAAAASIEESLSCTICLSVFNQPKALPCLHTFCEECLGDHTEATKKEGCFLCPLCKSKTAVPKNGVKGFKDNFYFNSLMDSLNIAPKIDQQLCELCQLDNVERGALFTCVQCEDKLCEPCSVAHTKTRMTREHKIVKLVKDPEPSPSKQMHAAKQDKCPHHVDHFLDIYCKNCESLTCSRCLAVSHANHTWINTRQATAEIRAGIPSTQQAIGSLTEYVSEFEEMQRYCDDEVTRLSVAISKHFDDVRKSATALETQLLSDVTSRGANIQTDLTTKLDKNRHQLKVYKDSLILSDKYINCTDEHEKRQQLKSVMDSLKKQEQVPGVYSVVVPKFSIRCSQLEDFQCTMRLQDETRHVSKMKLSTCLSSISSFKTELKRDKEPECFGIHFMNDRYLIADGNNGLKMYEKGGKFQRFIDHGNYKLTRPCDVTSNDKGEIFVTDNFIHGICYYDERFRQISVCDDIYRKWGRITCLGDTLLVSGNGCLKVLFYDDKYNEFVTEDVIDDAFLQDDDFDPNYVTMTPEGNIVTTCKRCVYILDGVDFSVLHIYHPVDPELGKPMGVCCDQWGHIFIIDQCSEYGFALHVISSSGNRLRFWHFDDWEATGITISGHGQLSVINRCGVVCSFRYLD